MNLKKLWSTLSFCALAVFIITLIGQPKEISLVTHYYECNVENSGISSISSIETVNWNSATPMTSPRMDLAVSVGHNGLIYAIGGYNTIIGGPMDDVEVYDADTKTWSPVASMLTPRMYLSAATGGDGRIYAIGGYNGGWLTTVEAYDPNTNTWSFVASLPSIQPWMAAAAGGDGRIYAIGGYDGSWLNRVESYDPNTNTWSTVASLPTARERFAAATGLDGRIYAIGGNSFSGQLNTVEVYNPSTNTWSTVLPMGTARVHLAATTGGDGSIYAIGGFDINSPTGTPLDVVEAYDPVSDTWNSVTSLSRSNSNLGAATDKVGWIYAIGGLRNGVPTTHVETYPAFAQYISVQIDIKPGSFPNTINLDSHGTVPIAILSTENFDATTVDPTTVTLAGASVRIKGKGTPQASAEDVNGDGLLDLIVHVDTTALELTGGDTEAILEGKTYDGISIRGIDTVRIVQE